MRIEGFKVCNTCHIKKSTEEFHLNKGSSFGVTGKCKDCTSIIRKADYYKNQERNLQYSRNYYDIPENKERAKKYIDNNREYVIKRQKKYYKYVKKPKTISKAELSKIPGTIEHLRIALRGVISPSFKRKKIRKKSKSSKILGCSYEEFRSYIENLWQPWMNWENYGNQKGFPNKLNMSWDLDHIIPLYFAKTEEELLKLNHFSNFQPLCSYTNRFIKRNKIL